MQEKPPIFEGAFFLPKALREAHCSGKLKNSSGTLKVRFAHMVFALKYRRKTFYGERRCKTGKILGKLCGMEMMCVSGFAGFLNGKRGLTVFERRSDIKFWSRGYYPRERTPARLQNICKIS